MVEEINPNITGAPQKRRPRVSNLARDHISQLIDVVDPHSGKNIIEREQLVEDANANTNLDAEMRQARQDAKRGKTRNRNN